MQSLPLQHKKKKKYERLTGAPQELGGRHGLSWGPWQARLAGSWPHEQCSCGSVRPDLLALS